MRTLTMNEADAMGPHFAAVVERWFPGHVKVEHFDPPAESVVTGEAVITDVAVGRCIGIVWNGEEWSWVGEPSGDGCALRALLGYMRDYLDQLSLIHI